MRKKVSFHMTLVENRTPSKRLGIISSQAFSICNFRGPLIKDLVSNGITVFAIAPDYNEDLRSKVKAMGAIPIDCTMERTGTHPIRDMRDLFGLVRILKKLDLDTSLGYFIKPVIYGSFAAHMAGVKQIFSMVEGLGFVFTPDGFSEPIKKKVLRKMILTMYRFAFVYNRKVFFLNPDDVNEFLSARLLSDKQIVKIPGIGVDLDYYASSERLLSSNIVFILIGRMLKEKGIYEYVEAARRVKKRYPDAKFLLVGGCEEKVTAIRRSEIEEWVREGVLEWPGHVSDIRSWIEKATVFVLPSYREGLPRSTQEAMAMGLPIITTDVPGCRETIIDGVNGYLVLPRNVESLYEAMCKFFQNPGLIETMGKKSQKICKERFDVRVINREIIQTLGMDKPAMTTEG